jgi:hypothetical protein
MASHLKAYNRVLCCFIEFLTGMVYDPDHKFEVEDILEITADDLLCYFNLRAYGTPEPLDTDLPTHCRSTTLAFYKKAISSFIPNRHHAYDVRTQQGHPTKAPVINDLIKRIKKHEVRAEGVPSQARRDLTLLQFREVTAIAEKATDFSLLLRIPTFIKFQDHLIARVDDTANFFAQEL